MVKVSNCLLARFMKCEVHLAQSAVAPHNIDGEARVRNQMFRRYHNLRVEIDAISRKNVFGVRVGQ